MVVVLADGSKGEVGTNQMPVGVVLFVFQLGQLQEHPVARIATLLVGQLAPHEDVQLTISFRSPPGMVDLGAEAVVNVEEPLLLGAETPNAGLELSHLTCHVRLAVEEAVALCPQHVGLCRQQPKLALELVVRRELLLGSIIARCRVLQLLYGRGEMLGDKLVDSVEGPERDDSDGADQQDDAQ